MNKRSSELSNLKYRATIKLVNSPLLIIRKNLTAHYSRPLTDEVICFQH